MVEITLPDGNTLSWDTHPTGFAVAEKIAPSLAKAAIAVMVDDELRDLHAPITASAKLRIITAKDPEALEIIRHSSAHLLAQAVKRLYPSVQVTIGPVIENGFYYDFSFERGFTPEDLEKIQQTMKKIVKEGLQVERYTLSRDEAIAFFKSQGEHYKAEIIADIPQDEILSLYRQGEFTDLCRGPHVPNTRFLKVFKVQHVAGAYWRGDHNNAMLQRIYGTAWLSKDDQDAYLHQLEEAKKRDHRVLAKRLDLWHFQDVAPGIAFFHPNGVALWRVVEDYMRDSNNRYGCEEIKTPLIMDESLWQQSGHKSKYSDEMFDTVVEKRNYVIRPMNCPGGMQVFNQHLHSYRDLPIRMAEFGIVHRNEPSGSLHGLMRARSFTQDDGHIFCTESQVQEEVIQMINQSFEVYRDFGFKEIAVKLATRPENRIGDDAVWDKSEQSLEDALNAHGVAFEFLPGEGAFYGPKIEFHIKDAIGRSWQCGTIQVDFSMPERLGAEYIDENSKKQHPVMLHRAIVGSLERFIAVVIEHYAGSLPLWLAPVQIVVLGVSQKHDDYVKKIVADLKKNGLRAQFDLRNEKIGYKIREHTIKRVPLMVVAGDKEIENQTLTLRTREGDDKGSMSLAQLHSYCKKEMVLQSKQEVLED